MQFLFSVMFVFWFVVGVSGFSLFLFLVFGFFGEFSFPTVSAEQFRKEALWGAFAFPAGLTRAMDWSGLEPIGAKFTDHVKHFFRDPSIFYVAIETEDDIRHVLQEAFGSADLRVG